MKKVLLLGFLLFQPLLVFSWEYKHTLQKKGDRSTENLIRVYECKDGSTATCRDTKIKPYKIVCTGQFRNLYGIDTGKLLQRVGCL